MGALDILQDGITAGIGTVSDFVGEHPVGVAIGAAGTAAAAAGIVALSSSASKTKTKRKTHKKITHTKRGWKQDRKRRSKQKWEVAYQKRKRKLKKRHNSGGKKRSGKVKYTKKGQPYIILRSGKARFIKKSKRRNK
jgi:ribulose kinase